MSRSRLNLQRHRAVKAPAHASSGFTLIELMVALVLGLIVIAGVVSVFLANQQVYRTNQAIGDVQDGSRIAFEMMAHDIRGAGLTGCSNNGLVANVLNNGPTNGGTDWWADMANAVHGYDTTQPDPAIAFGTSSTTRLSGTPSLQLIGAADLGLSVFQTQNAAQFKINGTSTAIQKGDVAIVCDPAYAAIFQITDYQNNNTVIHDTGVGVANPGNCSKGLGYPPVCTPTGSFYPYGPNSQLAKLTAVDWFIGTNPVGGRSLYRSDLENVGGMPTPVAQEMVRDVTGMSILYHQAPQTNFVTASAITNWAVVDAVQVSLTVASTDKRAGTDVQAITRSFSTTTTVRNRVH